MTELEVTVLQSHVSFLTAKAQSLLEELDTLNAYLNKKEEEMANIAFEKGEIARA